MITRNFNLNLYAGNSSPLVINVNQYDNGEQWVFTLYDENGVQYTPSTGAIVGIKSDGLGIINTGSVVDGKVVINETQQMTAAIGKATFELMLDSQSHGTANFVVLVEPKPGDNASLSESDLSLIQEALNATSPLPTGGTVGQVLTKTANGSAWSDAGTPTQEQVAEAVSDWADENITVETGVVIDNSLSVSGAAADSAKVGQELSDLKSQIAQSTGMSAEFKQALETLLAKVAYIDEDGQTYLDALHTAMYPPANLSSISAVYTQSGTVYDTASLDDLKSDLVVTAHYDNGTSEIVSAYTLSGVLAEGSQTITVAYGGKNATFTVEVTHARPLTYFIAIDPNDLTEGYINDNGEHGELSGSYYIDELYEGIAFSPIDSSFNPSSKSLRVAFYDSNQQFISRVLSSSTAQIVFGVSGTDYLKIGWVGATAPNYALIMGGINSMSFPNSNQTLNGSGELSSENNQATTDFLPVGDFSKYVLANEGGTIKIAFYDSSYTFIERPYRTASGITIGDIPANAVYFRMAINPTYSNYAYPLCGEG